MKNSVISLYKLMHKYIMITSTEASLILWIFSFEHNIFISYLLLSRKRKLCATVFSVRLEGFDLYLFFLKLSEEYLVAFSTDELFLESNLTYYSCLCSYIISFFLCLIMRFKLICKYTEPEQRRIKMWKVWNQTYKSMIRIIQDRTIS